MIDKPRNPCEEKGGISLSGTDYEDVTLYHKEINLTNVINTHIC